MQGTHGVCVADAERRWRLPCAWEHGYLQAGDLMVEIHVERTIAVPPQRVFEWLADPANLAAAPATLRAGWAKGSSAPGAGAHREVLAVGAWFREEITA